MSRDHQDDEMNIQCPVCDSDRVSHLRPYRSPAEHGPFAGLHVYRRTACSMGFAYPVPDEKALDQYYAHEYRTESDSARPISAWSAQEIRARSQVDFVTRQAMPLQIRNWLDIGAGFGFLLDAARELRATTAAIEPDQQARKRLTRQGHHTFEDLRAIDTQWDVISFSHVLEHVRVPRAFLAHVSTILTDGGCVFCEVPNEIRLSDAPNDLPHLLFFQHDSLGRLFEGAGFQIVALQSCGNRWDMSETTIQSQMQQLARRLGRRVLNRPPTWAARLLYPHYAYSGNGDRKWLRLVARKVA